MAQRLTRRAGPEHPVLFASEADIPPAPVLPDPGAAVELDSYRALLEEAEAIALAAVAEAAPGRARTDGATVLRVSAAHDLRRLGAEREALVRATGRRR